MKLCSTLLHAALCLGMALSGAAASQPTWETWVSGTGKDTGSCILTAPCATFQYAQGQTNPGGTIYAISSGSYGMTTITKSLSIIAADGVEASILVDTGKAGVTVNTTGVAVLLKGLHIVGQSNSASYPTFGVSVHLGAVTLDHDTIVDTEFGVIQYGGFVLVKSSVLQGNFVGASGNGSLYVGASTITANSYAFTDSISSYGDNDLNGNTACDVCQANVTEVAHDQ